MDSSKLRTLWLLILDASPGGLAEASEAVFISQLSTYINDNLYLSDHEQVVLKEYLQVRRHLILDILTA